MFHKHFGLIDLSVGFSNAFLHFKTNVDAVKKVAAAEETVVWCLWILLCVCGGFLAVFQWLQFWSLSSS